MRLDSTRARVNAIMRAWNKDPNNSYAALTGLEEEVDRYRTRKQRRAKRIEKRRVRLVIKRLKEANKQTAD
jgi:hypothetical protein